MRQVDWIIIVIGIIISFGAFIGTLMVAICAFFIKRLITSVDELKKATEKHTVELIQRPTWPESALEMKKISDARVTVHEKDYNHEPREGGREFSQRNT